MNRKTLFQPTQCLLILLFLLMYYPRLGSDGVFYYSYLPSIVSGGTLSAAQSLAANPEEWTAEFLRFPTDQGYFGNFFPMGPAFSWLPGYCAGRFLASTMLPATGRMPLSGFEFPVRYYSFLSSVILVLVGAGFIRRMLLQYVSSGIAETTTFLMMLGSPLLAYAYTWPCYSHSLQFCISAITCWYITGHDVPRSRSGIFLMGALFAVIPLTRAQDAGWLLALPLWILLDGVNRDGKTTIRTVSRKMLLAASGSMAVLSVQMHWWARTHGNPVFPPYSSSYFEWIPLHFFQVLFSTHNGLFTWHPVFIPAAAGLAALPRMLRRKLLILSPGVLVTLYLSSSVTDWCGGGCFGARRYCGLIPIFCLGFAALLLRLKDRPVKWILLAVASLGTLWNCALFLVSEVSMLRNEMMISQFIPALRKEPILNMMAGLVKRGPVGQWWALVQDPVVTSGPIVLLILLVIIPLACLILSTFIPGKVSSWISPRRVGLPAIAVGMVLALLSMHAVITLTARQDTAIIVVEPVSGIPFYLNMNSKNPAMTGYGVTGIPFDEPVMFSRDSLIHLAPSAEQKRLHIPLAQPVTASRFILATDLETWEKLTSHSAVADVSIHYADGTQDLMDWSTSMQEQCVPVFRGLKTDLNNGIRSVQHPGLACYFPICTTKSVTGVTIESITRGSDQKLWIYGMGFVPAGVVPLHMNSTNPFEYEKLRRFDLHMSLEPRHATKPATIAFSARNNGPSKRGHLLFLFESGTGMRRFYPLNHITSDLQSGGVSVLFPAGYSVQGILPHGFVRSDQTTSGSYTFYGCIFNPNDTTRPVSSVQRFLLELPSTASLSDPLDPAATIVIGGH
jgi:hypothetical protein